MNANSLAYVLAVWLLSAATAAAAGRLGGLRGPGGSLLYLFVLLPGLTALGFTLAGPGPRLARMGFNSAGGGNYVLGWGIATAAVSLSFALTVAAGAGRLDTSLAEVPAEALGATRLGAGGFIGITFLVNLFLIPGLRLPFALGSELGWRAFLTPRLIPHGKLAVLLLPGLAAGVSQLPLVGLGHGYRGHPAAGVPLMIAYHTLIGVVLGWLYLRTRSIIVVAFTQGVFESLPMAFLPVVKDYDPRIGSASGLIGLAVLAAVAVPLIARTRLADIAAYKAILPASLAPEPARPPRRPWVWPE